MRLLHPGPRILDFDIECRPLSWYGGDFVTKEVTAVACRFLDRGRTKVWLLGPHTLEEILEGFRREYDKAGMVTGHFIRGFDLPVLMGAMAELGLRPLDDKMTHDTKLDLVRMSGLSKSQENLAAMFELRHPKVSMNQAKWRAANRLTLPGIAATRRRVAGDVAQHIELREELLRRGLLGPPRVWRAVTTGTQRYQG